MVIKNYSGDIMNFGLSADLAEMDDIEVAQVIVKMMLLFRTEKKEPAEEESRELFLYIRSQAQRQSRGQAWLR